MCLQEGKWSWGQWTSEESVSFEKVEWYFQKWRKSLCISHLSFSVSLIHLPVCLKKSACQHPLRSFLNPEAESWLNQSWVLDRDEAFCWTHIEIHSQTLWFSYFMEFHSNTLLCLDLIRSSSPPGFLQAEPLFWKAVRIALKAHSCCWTPFVSSVQK